MGIEDLTPHADALENDGESPFQDRSYVELLAELRFLAQENGRLRAERDLLRAERDRLTGWLETDRELTNRMLTALEAELRALRHQSAPAPAAPPVAAAPLAVNDPGPSLRTGIGRRFRDRTSDSG